MEAGFSGQLVLAGVVVMVVGILVLDGRVVANGAVAAIRVEPVHPTAGGELKIIDGVEWSVVADALRFVEPVRALSERIVIALSGQSWALRMCRPFAWCRSVGFGSGVGFESAESFFLVSDSVGEGADGGAEVSDFGGEAGEGAGVVAAVFVFLDHGPQLWIAVESRATDPSSVGDRGERDRHAGSGEFTTDRFDEGGVRWAHPVCAIR